VDIDECAGDPVCDENATCINTEGSYTCTCNPGYTGDGHHCELIVDCSNNPDICDVNASCEEVEGQMVCVCNEGYAGDGLTCSLLADCIADPSLCDENATCTQLDEGYACVCNDGYTGNGATCAPDGWLTVAGSADYTCAIRRAGTLWCWGDIPEGNQADWPVRVSTDTDWEHLATGFYHICALKTDGSLWCWGNGRDGKLGLGPGEEDQAEPVQVGTATDWVTEPVEVVGLPPVTRLAENNYGGSHYCALVSDGTVWCWGRNDCDQLGDGT
jgi:alpha-tubulin suppressor-like RCC1 family protein